MIISTASPYKFGETVLKAIDPNLSYRDDFEMAERLQSLSKRNIPNAINDIRNAEILHKEVCDVPKMHESVKKILFGS